jgi:hypothetical protein
MCTVTFIPASRKRGFVLTSNRDERASRPTKAPMIYEDGIVHLVYPKDEQSGGTWIAASNQGKINCLLNGGFERHQIQAHQILSRGIILLDFTKSELSAQAYFTDKDLHPVEPFTMISIQQMDGKVIELTEIIWDGEIKHFRNPAINEAHIWSSTTLYSEEQRNLRKKWFADFLDSNQDKLEPENIMEFHSGTHSQDPNVNVIMKGIEDLKTVSITQVSIDKKALLMNYFNLQNDSKVEITI